MATFILLSMLTDEGAGTITARPERIEEVDGDLTISRVSAQRSSRGAVRTLTPPAIPIDECISGLRR